MTGMTPYISLGLSDADPMARVFFAHGTILRGIHHDCAETVQELFDHKLIDKLQEHGFLTPTSLSSHQLNGFAFALEQPELTPPVTTRELPPSLRRDAGLLLLELSRLLDQEGYVLRDMDLSGVIIDKRGRPVFHRIEAITPKGTRKFPYAEFHANFFGPVRLVHEKPELADLIQRTDHIGVDEDISIRHPIFRRLIRQIGKLGATGKRLSNLYQRFFVLSPFGGLLHTRQYFTFVREALREQRARKSGADGAPARWTGQLIEGIIRRMQAFRFNDVAQRWTDYHADLNLEAISNAMDNGEAFFKGPREQALLKVLRDADASTLIDIGANNGYFSMLGAHCDYDVTAVDYDIGAIDNLYRLLKNGTAKQHIRPLVFDFVNLTPQHWPRFRADVVFALGFVHHMRLVELLPWSVIAERLAGLTGKVLVTEFKPGTGAGHAKREMVDEIADDYRLENLVRALEDFFPSVEVVGDYSMIGADSLRTMIVCKR